MNYRWRIASANAAAVSRLAAELGVAPLLAQCLLNRGVTDATTAASYLHPRLKELSDPFRLPNMDRAVERLWQAIRTGESIVLFGDYDVDGVTATTLLMAVLAELGGQVKYYLPNRMDDGYGLNREAVEKCLERTPATLLVALDCGSTAIDAVTWLGEKGVDVLVFDHHQPSSPAPQAHAIVNPHLLPADQPGMAGPYHELCSVGIAFKAAHALIKHGRQLGDQRCAAYDLKPLLDLVALGTVADIVPLIGENRILVTAGLEWLGRTRRPGLQAMMQKAQVSRPLNVHAVGFQLAPRLNAAGRLEDAEAALRLLTTSSASEAEQLAGVLETNNRDRQELERQITTEVIEAVRARFKADHDYVIVEGSEKWHIGVVGIVASRVLRQFYRPTILLGGDGEVWRGSGRSIEGFDLADALRECHGLLLRHGGHAMAAGVSLESSQVDAFRERLNHIAQERIQPEQLRPALRLDAEVVLGDINEKTIQDLALLEPVGQGNPCVQLMARGVHMVRSMRMGKEQQHLKLWITDGNVTHEAVWWGGAALKQPEGSFDLAFQARLNEFNGRRTVQLGVLDWQDAGVQPSAS